jgi:hypothetical protein
MCSDCGFMVVLHPSDTNTQTNTHIHTNKHKHIHRYWSEPWMYHKISHWWYFHISRKLISLQYYEHLSRDSPFGEATGLLVRKPRNWILIPKMSTKIFSSPERSTRHWGPTILCLVGFVGFFFRRQRGQGVKLTTHLHPPSNVGVKNRWLYTSALP